MPIPGHPCTYCVWGTSAGICGTSQERERHICLSALGSSASFVPSTFAGPRAAATSQPPPALWPAPSALILPSDSLPLSALPDWGGGGGATRGRLEAQAEDHRACRRLPLTGAEDWQDTELRGVQGAGGDKPSLAVKREPQARVKSCQADTRPAWTGICTPAPACLSFPNNFSEFHLLVPLASLTS